MKINTYSFTRLSSVYFAVLFVACNNLNTEKNKNNLDKNEAVIFIRDDNNDSLSRTNYGLGFYYSDSSVTIHPPILFTKDTTRLLIAEPVWFRQLATQTPFLIYPGDTVHIVTDTFDKVFIQTKSNRYRDNELAFFPNLIARTGTLQGLRLDSFFIKAKNIQDIFAILKNISDRRNIREQLLKEQLQNKNISDEFYRDANSLIQYTAVSNKLYLILANQGLLAKNKLYDSLFNSCLLDAKQLPFNRNFMCYQVNNNLVSVGTGNKMNVETRDLNDLKRRMDFIVTNFDGQQKNFLLFSLVSGAVSFYHIDVPESIIRQYDSACDNPFYKNAVHNIIKEQSVETASAKEDNILFMSDFNTKISLQEIFTANKGSLILLDFWASWCAPCRKEIPYLKQLETQYTGKKIVFYSISIDSKVNDWKAAIKEENLINKTSCLLLNADKSSFIQQNKISVIPRYILIGKDGKIISADAPRPSDKALQELIEKNL